MAAGVSFSPTSSVSAAVARSGRGANAPSAMRAAVQRPAASQVTATAALKTEIASALRRPTF